MDNLAQTEATKQRAHWMVSLENNLAITIKFLNSEHPPTPECILSGMYATYILVPTLGREPERLCPH